MITYKQTLKIWFQDIFCMKKKAWGSIAHGALLPWVLSINWSLLQTGHRKLPLGMSLQETPGNSAFPLLSLLITERGKEHCAAPPEGELSEMLEHTHPEMSSPCVLTFTYTYKHPSVINVHSGHAQERHSTMWNSVFIPIK